MVQRDDPGLFDWGEVNAEVYVVRSFGDAHPGVLVSVRVEVGTPLQVVALLSPWEFDDHADALRALMARPDRLKIEQSRWAASYLEEIAAEIHDLALASERGVIKQVGVGWGTVDIGLGADQEALAAQLDGRYGGAVGLTVGQFPYPPGRPPTLPEQISAKYSSAPDRATPSRPQALPVPGLETQLELTPPEVRSGREGHGHVVVRNVGSRRVEIQTDQHLVGAVIDPVSGDTVGGGRMFVAGTGLLLALEPGEEATIHVVYSTASGRRELGYALPPGHYIVRTEVPIHADGPEPNGPARVLSVTPAELLITRRRWVSTISSRGSGRRRSR